MATAAEDKSEIRSGVDHVECYRSMGRRCDITGGWKLQIRGRVVQARPDNLRRKLLTKLLCQAMKPTVAELNSDVFRARMDSFLVLTCPKTRVAVRLGNQTLPLKKRSKRNGTFQQTVTVPVSQVGEVLTDPGSVNRIQIAPVVQGDNEQDLISPQSADVHLVPPVGVSVITDIDDTLKLTDVGNRRQMLANTFLREFRAVPGMAEVYQRWQEHGASFHYVSSSPWQLYRPLVEFVDAAGFPGGSFHLRTLKLQGPSILRLLTGGRRSKKKSIRAILKWYPGRQFVLIGDAGENDPEIYGSIARKNPVQVAGVFIRNLAGASMTQSRFAKAFRNLPSQMWHIYDDPTELNALTPIRRDGIMRWTPAGVT